MFELNANNDKRKASEFEQNARNTRTLPPRNLNDNGSQSTIEILQSEPEELSKSLDRCSDEAECGRTGSEVDEEAQIRFAIKGSASKFGYARISAQRTWRFDESKA
jgi:hypothetical protein